MPVSPLRVACLQAGHLLLDIHGSDKINMNVTVAMQSQNGTSCCISQLNRDQQVYKATHAIWGDMQRP